MKAPYQSKAVWPLALMLTLVCLGPVALMLAPPATGTMLAIYGPGMSARETLLAASAAGARAAEPLAGGIMVRAEMPATALGPSGASALRAQGALLVIAPIAGWACPPGPSPSEENRQ
ncbi:MAG: hypothetical protein HLUCCA04_09390 [Oceanicaulis sp. HLUCCA04]|nr:MAG: hypothetical protein HLUCCA04_09390 [Oceanicaulis sp. HLUCCA04]